MSRVIRTFNTWAALPLALWLAATLVPAQHQAGRQHHGQHATQAVGLEVHDDPATQTMTVRLGPIGLPADSNHDRIPQPEDVFLEVPFDGWIIAYHPRLVDGAGNAVPSKVLHHVAFWNTQRPDFLCPNKEEHIFGAGGEMNDWPALPGFGYPVGKGERIRISTMFHNPTPIPYPETYLEVALEYRGPEAGLKSVYPAWFDVQACGRSSYSVRPGYNVSSTRMQMPYSGALLGVGGHLHDFGRKVVLRNVSRGHVIATLAAKLDQQGRILEMPIANFAETGGYRLEKGETVEVSAEYADRELDDVMGIVVGYFLPDDPHQVAALRR